MMRLLPTIMVFGLILFPMGYTGGSPECPDGEETITTPSFDMVVTYDDEWAYESHEDNTACCPEDGDFCVFNGECYSIGDIIDENPRYACGTGNKLIEALGMDYEHDEEFLSKSVDDPTNAYTVQEGPVYADIISCNNHDALMPNIWTDIEKCAQGEVLLKMRDGSSGNIWERDTEITLELFKYGRLSDEEYERFTTNISIERDGDTLVLEGLLGSYYNMIMIVEGGHMGSISSVRVDHDGDPETHIVDTFRDNTCEQCIDYSLGPGLCNRDCESRGLNEICSFASEEIMDKCHMRAPGTRVTLENGTRVECCNDVIGMSLPEVKADVECEYENLVRKEYPVRWRGRALKIVVTSCGE